MSENEDFNDEYASPPEWARMYRSRGLQVVPAHTPETSKNWKRPALNQWTSFTKEIVSDEQFDLWYGARGEHVHRYNMGLITGSASGGVFVVDLDTHKNDDARRWWENIHAENNMGLFLETPAQTTGGGGKQYFFRAPKGWVAPTIKTSIGVDIRGEGGFAMLPPSKHESGKLYDFDYGFGIHECDISEAPAWLCEEIDILAAQNGHIAQTPIPVSGQPTTYNTPHNYNSGGSPHVHHPFGGILDGREDYMTKMVWAKVVDLHRAYPNRGFDEEHELQETFKTYADHVRSRFTAPDISKEDLLENESRGITLFRQKWRKAMSKWDTKVNQHASVENPKKQEGDWNSPHNPEQTSAEQKIKELSSEFDGGKDLFTFYSVREIKQFPDPLFLIEDRIIENSFVLLVGQPGCGKTFVALSIALSLAMRRGHWWQAKLERTGPVLYISSEGRADLKFRIWAWEIENGVETDDSKFMLLDQTVNFLDPQVFIKLVNSIKSLVENILNEPLAAIFVDTVSRAIPGADENLQKDMTPFVEKCGILQRVFTTSVIGVHHTNRSGGLRGTTVFDGAADTIMMISRDHEEGKGQVYYQKIKAARDHWHEDFDLKSIVIKDGIKPKTSLVAIPFIEAVAAPQTQNASQEGYGGRQETNQVPDMDMCRRMQKAIGEAYNRGTAWSMDDRSKKYDRYAPRALALLFSVDESVIEKLARGWVINGLIVAEDVKGVRFPCLRLVITI